MFDWFLSLFDHFSGDEVNEIAQDAYDVGYGDGGEAMYEFLDEN
jgi:hypothetical protein